MKNNKIIIIWKIINCNNEIIMIILIMMKCEKIWNEMNKNEI